MGFRLTGGEQPLALVPVTVNDAGPFDFILDTGASATVLAAPLARDLGIAPEETREARGAGGRLAAATGSVRSIAVGSAQVDGSRVGIADLADIARGCGAELHGALGCDFLQRFLVQLDYAERRLLLARPGEVELAGERIGPGVPLRIPNPDRPLAFVPAWVNGRGPFEFVVETGAGVTVLSRELAEGIGLRSGGSGVALGAGGAVRAMPARLESLAVGAARREGQGVVVGDFLGPIAEAVGAKIDGLLGHDFLRRHHVTLDYPERMLHLF